MIDDKLDILALLRSPSNIFYDYEADDGAMLRQAADEIERLRNIITEIKFNIYSKEAIEKIVKKMNHETK